MPGVFISYRREDSSGYAGRLFDILSAQFGKSNVFMDLDTILGGDEFAAVIKEKVNESDVLVALIGNHWLTVTEGNGTRRLDNPLDFVRTEIAGALERGIRVIPVLVAGATLPKEADLPAPLQAMCERQTVEIRDSHFHPDAQQLVDVLHTALNQTGFRHQNVNPKRLILIYGAAILIIISGILLFQHRKSLIQTQVQVAAAEAKTPPNIAGRWTATVKYDWGATYNELFDLQVDGAELSGTASFLGDREGHSKPIFDGKITGEHISFTTKSLNMLGSGDQASEDRHYYKGKVDGQGIEFTMVTDSSVQSHSPIHFTANKIEAK